MPAFFYCLLAESVEAKTTETADQPDVLKLALERFALSAEAEAEQRTREEEDLRFVDFDEQWPEDIKRARQGATATGQLPAVQARPCLTINKLRHPVQQVTNQARQSRLALSFAAKSGDASVDVAEAYEDIVRAIQTDSRAHLARQWAFERAAKCGRGVYRILTEYANDGDFDLDIVYKRVLNQSTVYLDPFATEPDWSDGEWAFITEDMPVSRFRREFGESVIAKMSDDELRGLGDDCPKWVQFGDDGKPLVRVAEYFYVERTKQTICLYKLENGDEKSFPTDGEIPPGAQKVLDQSGTPIEREQEVRKVKWAKLTASEILEEQDWPGRYIPIVPVIGMEANVNGERRWTGLVRPARDAQVSYNVMRSAQVETIGLATKAPYIGYMETIEGFEDWWAQANVRNFPMLPVKFVRDAAGHPLPIPQRQVAEPAIQAITLAAHEADNDVKATTAIFDPSLGNMDPNERSGKAIMALQKQAETGTASYLDNLASMSMIYEGKILKDLLPKIYNRAGRIVAAIGADDQRRQLLLGVPFTSGPKGKPQPQPEGTPGAKTIDLATGEYSVAVTVGKSFTTRREEGVAAMSEVISAVPQLMSIVGDLYVGNMDFPGARQMADRMKKTLPPQLQDDQDQAIPPKVMQQMQQAQQVIDLLTKELDKKTRIIETDSVKSSADLERERMKVQADIETTKMQEETKIRIAAINAQLKQLEQQRANEQANLDRAADAEKHQRDLHSKAQEGERTRAHERAGNVFEAGVDAIQQDATRAHAMVEADTSRQHEAQLTEQQMAHESEIAKQQQAQAGPNGNH